MDKEQLKAVLSEITPPAIWRWAMRTHHTLKVKLQNPPPSPALPPALTEVWPEDPNVIYSDSRLLAMLETWGAGNAWHEIGFLIAGHKGKVLDIACGSGQAILALNAIPAVEVYGCDLSSLFLEAAKKRGILSERLTQCDATLLPFDDNSFELSYSLGSLEHFSEPNIERFLEEARRVSSLASYHLIPISKDGRDHGFVHEIQYFFKNSVDWWLPRFEAHFPKVIVLPSLYDSPGYTAKWFLCFTEKGKSC